MVMRITWRAAYFVGFHSRASRCASAICAGVILALNSSRPLIAHVVQHHLLSVQPPS